MFHAMVIAVFLAANACGTDPLPQGPGGGGSGGSDENTWELPVSWTIQPGEEVQYVDMPYAVAGDVAITRVRSKSGPGGHHVVGWDTSLFPFDKPGPFIDPSLTIFGGVPFFVSGTSPGDLKIPPGYAYPLGDGRQVTVQAHFVNTTNEPIMGQMSLLLTLADDPSAFIPVAATGMENQDIMIPAGAAGHVETMSCAFPLKLGRPYAVYPHAHRYATWMKVVVEKGGDPAAPVVLHDGAWNFGDQPIYQLDTALVSIDEGDVLKLYCTYDNPTPNDLVRGESSADEMCAAVLFLIEGNAAPGDKLELHGCISGNAF